MVFPMEKEWDIAPIIPENIQEELNGYSNILQQLLFNRGITSEEAISQFFLLQKNNYDPFLFLQMKQAVDRIIRAIDAHEKIAVYGDYDVDGISATALLTQVLQAYGSDVVPYIPDRFDEGYGVNTKALDSLLEQGVKLVITVDCGIRSPLELAYASKKGMGIIVTDHHEPGEILPEVVAIVCQHLPGDLYPDKFLCGAGLAYKVAQALLMTRPISGTEAAQWLDLAALGTVADVVPLIGENRFIVHEGLKLMRMGKRVGLTALIKCAGLRMDSLAASDISFGIAPRLNAAGRLKSPRMALNILLSDDLYNAGMLAQELDDLNRERQHLTRDIQLKAEEQLQDFDEYLLFAVDEAFNSGVVGLVAAKLTEFYYRPSIIGFRGDVNTRASCRSIPEFHIIQALDQCNDLLLQHGGHAMAAGFTVANENVPELMERLVHLSRVALENKVIQPKLRADMEIPLKSIPATILKDLLRLEPIGAANPEAMFVSRNVNVKQAHAVGKDKNHLKLIVQDGAITYDAIGFHLGYWMKAMPSKIDLLYSISENNFNGNRYTQLNVKDLKSSN
ncbi:MAG: single-stranded-DNA-specific exonuclease RecJ [Chloroflexi bacterium HGW-Chloroflexi-10]|nr:MAG: single-stranded-DNA-specific exonuclease RecJ [Chloroflexi bacterium HGW-Chloroflexi-10]